MVEVIKEQPVVPEVTYTFNFNEKEAKLLKSFCQNGEENEPPEFTALRSAIWHALNRVGL